MADRFPTYCGALAAAIGLLLAMLATAHESKSPLYQPEQFQKAITEKPHFILFFVPWCPFCQELMPVWEQLYDKYEKLGAASPVALVRMDCDKENKPYCRSQGTRSYPWMKLYTPTNTNGTKYEGKRELAPLEDWLNKQLAPEAAESNTNTAAPQQ